MTTRTDEVAARAVDARLLDVARDARPSAWERLAPWPVMDDLRPLGRALDDPAAGLEEDERAGAYPARARAALHAAGLPEVLSEPPEGPAPGPPRWTPPHLHGLNVLMARCGASIAVTVGVNALALIPVWLGAGPALLARVHRRVREGAFASMLLTELPHGSNLLRNELRAERGGLGPDGAFRPADPADPGAPRTHYRLAGEKDMINGGNEHAQLVTLARTRAAAPGAGPLQVLSDFTLFVVERDARTAPLPRWRTLPAQAADISGVRFEGRVVAQDDVVGAEGAGFKLVRRTLTVSRGGIAALAAGTAARAVDLALAWARGRDVYGGPILRLGPVADHLARALALEQAVAALAVHAAAATNAHGTGAATATAAAKLGCCALAEECVREGARILGGRALVEDLPYARVSRDVLLFGVFDGTSHVVGDELAQRYEEDAARWARGEPPARDPLAAARALYATPPRRVAEVLRGPAPAVHLPLPERLAALATLPGDVGLEPVAALAAGLYAAVAGARAAGSWTEDGALRFQAAEAGAELEALAAGAELADPARRAALGLRPLAGGAGPLDALAWRVAVGLLGARVADRLRGLAARAGLPPGWAAPALARQGGLEGCAAALHALDAGARRETHAALLAG